MSKCIIHPTRNSVVIYENFGYCTACTQSIFKAVSFVGKHVQPKDCFVWYEGAKNWQPIPGTGCAHWVAHQLNIKNGKPGEKCLKGYPFRVSTLIQNKTEVKQADVRINDIYVTPDVKHTGLVSSIIPPNPENKTAQRILIRHDSSAQGGVVVSEFATHFKGHGKFYRK